MTQPDNIIRVLAVVVTHNRRELLSRCLDAIDAQTASKPDVLVINNGSTDGTKEMLEARKVGHLNQDNVGSAGGWYRGIQEAVTRGYDAVWLMDDDGYPDINALSILLSHLDSSVSCVSSVVMREDAREWFVFPFPKLDRKGLPKLVGFPRKFRTLRQLRKLAPNGVYEFAHFFNGALVSIESVKRAGNVDRDFFIFGDEVDYFFRLRLVGRVVSVLDAHHYHPDVTRRPYTPAKIYYYLKNTVVLNHRYFDHAWLRDVLAVAAVVFRTLQRNGFIAGGALMFGPRDPLLWSALRRGWQGRVGRDYGA